MTKRRSVRIEPRPPDEAVLVRAIYRTDPGGALYDREKLVGDVEHNFTEFGYYGLSLCLATDLWPVGRLLARRFKKARHVALYRAGELRGAGFGLVPSGRYPHYDASYGDVYGASYADARVTAASAVVLVDLFLTAPYALLENVHYSQDTSPDREDRT